MLNATIRKLNCQPVWIMFGCWNIASSGWSGIGSISSPIAFKWSGSNRRFSLVSDGRTAARPTHSCCRAARVAIALIATNCQPRLAAVSCCRCAPKSGRFSMPLGPTASDRSGIFQF